MASSFKKNQPKTSSRKSQTLINSPIVKRLQNRPVALQGWLLKRGSDGLMLWKKRWFVLSDYCLFYYKDTLEEKLLGSLVLASYKISQCSPDEKGFKKFSFKAEHTNMRTYYFAAENQILMEQWIKAMTLASLLEENISCERLMSDSSNIYSQHSRQCLDYLLPSQEVAALSGLRTLEPQPVYANAPPKPKRLNESSSPECSTDMQFREDSFQNYQNQSYPVIYNNINPNHQYNMTPSKQGFIQYDRTSAEMYGRTSALQSMRNNSNQNSPCSTTLGTIPLNIPKDNSLNSKNVSFSFPPRPHSVDFLEYSGKNSTEMTNDLSEKNKLHLRPKSSLSTVNAHDDDTWTAEEYARRMRQSSLYVKPTAKRSLSAKNEALSGNTSTSSNNSNANTERQLFKNDLAPKSEKVSGVLYRTRNMSVTKEDPKFSRSASARLFRPMSDCRDELFSQRAPGSSPINLPTDNPLSNKEPPNKVYQREEAMKRLLEWKNRMTHSSLRKPHNKNFIPERHSSYIGNSGCIVPLDHRNDNQTEYSTVTKTPAIKPEKVLNQPSNQITTEIGKNTCLSTPPGTLFQFYSDDGLEGCESNYGNSGPIIGNNVTERERRNKIVDENSKIPTDPMNQLRMSDGLDYSNNKLFPVYHQDSNIQNNLELSTNSDCLIAINDEDESHLNKLTNNSLNAHENSKKMNLSNTAENKKDEEWGIKLDESKVIKEFSYHYITSGKYEECQSKNEMEAHKNLNSKIKNKTTSQELIDIQFSKQHFSNTQYYQTKNDFKKFSFNEPSKHLDGSSIKKESNVFQKFSSKAQKKSNKGIIITKGSSVRTYRRDPNKPHPKEVASKSLILNSDNTDRRLVQSDSEALLYDTSSDPEDKIDMFSRDYLEKRETSSDDERDEEVAAVLSKENVFTSTVFDQVNSPFKKCNSTDNLQLSTLSNFLPNELEIQSNNEQASKFQISHEKNLSTSTEVNSDVPEENYMPMTPRKKSEPVHSRSNSASHTLIMENLLGSTEESPYVEMTQNGPRESGHSTRSFNKNNSEGKNGSSYMLHAETERYCEIGKSKDIQYEMIYNSSTLQEPLYMEVPSIKGKDDDTPMLTILSNDETIRELNKKNNSKENLNKMKLCSRPSLPDILNTTTPTLNQGSGRSDSSDADDEASKDLDSLDAPRHPRFSLSDTFRPASYYLGASLGDRAIITMNTEHHDSSDSDLVSPPPIPTSSPPLDDPESSMEPTVILKESSLSTLKSDSSNIYSNESFLHSNGNDFISSYKMKNSLRNSNSNLYEASSEESVNYEKREERLKRRPLSADILRSLQDINFIIPSSDTDIKSSELSSEQTKINSYFDDDQSVAGSDHTSNVKLYKYTNKNIDIYFAAREDMSNDNDSESDIRYKDNRYIQNEPIYRSRMLSSPTILDNHCIQNPYENLPTSNSDYKYFIEKYNSKENSENFQEKLPQNKENKTVNIHPNEHQNNAPYYYSDLLKIDTKNFQEFDKNRWDEHILCENGKDSPLLSTEKAVSKMQNYNQYNDSDSSKRDHGAPENTKYEATNSQMRAITKSLHYNKYATNNENTNKSFKKRFSPQRESSELQTPHRTRSLEGLIDNHSNNPRTANDDIFKKNSIRSELKSSKILPENIKEKGNLAISKNACPPNQDIWEEDTLWRESLRKVSIRHTRSLEDLDRKDCQPVLHSPSPNVSEETKTYENIRATYMQEKSNQNYVIDINEQPSKKLVLKHDVRYQNEKILDNLKKCESPKNIEIDGNSQKSFNQRPVKEPADGSNNSFEIDREKLRQWDLMSSAPAMLNSNRAIIKPITDRKSNFPPSIPGVHLPQEPQSDDKSELHKEANKPEKPSPTNISGLLISQEQDQSQAWNLKVSAGELLGRTHEELVLLLIQLRRQRATVCQSMEKCHREIETKACLADLDKANRVEHLKKLDELKAKLADLEKQYEKGKPLVNLVDNMVKLGSLYQAGSPQKIEFIQRIQEQRLLAEERRDWDRIRPDHHELKAKVERLYRLDKLLQEESGTLHSLQQDKGVLERALGGLRNKLQGIHGNTPETEWYKRQQRLLERELSRVRSILALNSKKLEETVAENARLEQELVVLRQKLQLSRRSAEPGSTNTAALEAELCRVQLLVGNLLRQRQELSLQVRQLTEKSNSLSRQIWPNSPDYIVEGANYGKKQLTNGWIETDLDADVSTDISNMSSICHSTRHQPVYISPLYVNTTDRESVDCSNYQDELFDGSPLSARSPDCSRVSESNEEDIFKQSYGLHLKEKPQEIKTVRIVKRESERRQRDRDRSGNIGIPITYTNPKRPITDDRFSDKTKSERELEEVVEVEYKANEPPPTPGPRTDSVNAVWNLVRKNKMKGKLVSRNTFDNGESLVTQTDSPQLSPVYLSETARKIVEEVAWQGMSEKRLVPKEKRRHHTMSGPSLVAPQNLFSQMGSRDDLDIERVLRPRLTTPDVVRSTLIRVDPHYTKETIDNILGAPGKILIPERYIPESQPQLTKEEQSKRSKKADAIRKMLCETAAVAPKESDTEGAEKTSSLKRKVAEEKKNREHLLQLSQILAHQVMEKSKIVAGANPTAVE